MFIEFHCPACNQRLRVPESAGGKQAKCPGCEQINDIPMASTVASESAVPVPPPGVAQDPFGAGTEAGYTPDEANPFASPAATVSGNQVAPWPSAKLEATYAVSTAWTLFKDNLGVVFGGFVLIAVINYAISFIQQMLQMVVMGMNQQGGGGEPPVMLFAIMGVFFIISQSVQVFLTIGFVRIMLEVARGRSPEFKVLFSGAPWFLRSLGGGILYGLMVLLGFIALIVPGIYLALRYWPYLHFIVDTNCGIGEAFSKAGEATKNNMGEGFILGLIGIGLMILGFLMFCVGVLATAPLVSLSWTVGYFMITGQPFRQQQRI